MGCLRLDILDQNFVPMQIVYKGALGIDPLADQGGQQTLSPYHAMACNPALMVDPLGLLSNPNNDISSPYLTLKTPVPVYIPIKGNSVWNIINKFENIPILSPSELARQEFYSKMIVASLVEGIFSGRGAVFYSDLFSGGSGGQTNDGGALAAGAIPLGVVAFSEYLKSISLTTGIEVTLDLSAAALTAARAVSLTLAAVATPLSAGAGSSITEQEEATYLAASRIAATTGTVPATYHGNDRRNQNPHGVYMIYSGGGLSFQQDIYKYAITGRTDFQDNRREVQVRRLNNNGSGIVYNWFWVAQNIPGNGMARMIELYHVSQYYMRYGDIPEGNKRPNPVHNPTFLNTK